MVGGTVTAAASARRAAARTQPIAAVCVKSSVTSAAASTTPSRITAKASVRSTTSRSRSACCRRAGIERVAIVDLDVHHGNGTAFIFESDPRVFTFSMHQQHNYPMWKPRGRSTSACRTARTTRRFLRELERALPAVMASDPQCVFYLAGADPYEDDQLGGLRLTKEGLRERDRHGDRRRPPAPACRWSIDARRRLRPPGRRHGRDPRGDDRGSSPTRRGSMSSRLDCQLGSVYDRASARRRSSDRRCRRARPSPRASASVNACASMSSSSSGWCGESAPAAAGPRRGRRSAPRRRSRASG